jgi:arsenate reductase (glutaredoxin)
MITLYGIKNCQSVAKARTWLETNKIEYILHNYKKQGIDLEHLQKWFGELGWEKVLNRSGMIWRKAGESEKQKVIDKVTAIEFMLRVPTLIKRPIMETENGMLLGFVEDEWNLKLK